MSIKEGNKANSWFFKKINIVACLRTCPDCTFSSQEVFMNIISPTKRPITIAWQSVLVICCRVTN